MKRNKWRAAFSGVLVSSFVLLFAHALAGDSSSQVLNRIKEKYESFENEIKDMRLVMEIETDATGTPVRARQTVLKKGEKIRVESFISLPSEKPETSIFIYDGENSWVISPEKGMTEQFPRDKARQFQTEEKWWNKVLERAKVKGEEQIGGKEAFVIEIEDEEGGPPASLWIEKEDLVLLQAESRTAGGKSTKWVFSDFRKVNHWDMPYKTEMFVGDALQSTSTIKSFEINKGLSDEVFIPETARK